MDKERQPLEIFQERLQAFVLFHLGTDAEVTFQDCEDGGAKVDLSHSRVHDFSMSLDRDRLRQLAASAEETEEFLLDQLTAHRRGGLAR